MNESFVTPILWALLPPPLGVPRELDRAGEEAAGDPEAGVVAAAAVCLSTDGFKLGDVEVE